MAQPDVSPMPDDLSSPWRDDFPIFRTQPDFAYLDTASSAQKPDAVIARIRAVMEGEYANIHRGLYQLSQNLTEEYEAVRQSAMAFLNAPAAEGQVIFTRNATEAVNLVAQSWGRTFLEAGDEVIRSEMEHHANIVP